MAPLLAGVRGESPADVRAWADAAVCVGALLLDDHRIRSVDINPLMLGNVPRGSEVASGAVAVDAAVYVVD
jgi:hypothetical protein